MISILVKDGEISMIWIRDGTQYTINCNIKVNDGQLHSLNLHKNQTHLSFKLDNHEPIEHELFELRHAKFSGNLFVGGHFDEFRSGKPGLKGCIHQMFLDFRQIDFEKDAIKTANV